MESVNEKSIRMAEEWLDNVDDDIFISEYKDIVERQQITNDRKELTEFDIFEALDRTSTIIKMTSELLGYVGLDDEENYLEDVHPAIEKHYAILRNVQDNLMELYQQLGQDLYEKKS